MIWSVVNLAAPARSIRSSHPAVVVQPASRAQAAIKSKFLFIAHSVAQEPARALGAGSPMACAKTRRLTCRPVVELTGRWRGSLRVWTITFRGKRQGPGNLTTRNLHGSPSPCHLILSDAPKSILPSGPLRATGPRGHRLDATCELSGSERLCECTVGSKFLGKLDGFAVNEVLFS